MPDDPLQNVTSTPAILSSVASSPNQELFGHGPDVAPQQSSLDQTKFVIYKEGFNSQAMVPLQVKSGDIYSRALSRAHYLRNSVHNAEQEFTLQVSNYYAPTDDQWEDVDTGNFIHTDYPVNWIRIKLAAAATEATIFYVQSHQS